jgi:hypothetical protein
LIAAGGANATVVERIFDEASEAWANRLTVRDSKWPVTDFRSLLTVPAGYRTKLIARCIADKTGLGKYFIQGYSRIGVIGEAGLYGDEWRDCASEIVEMPLDPEEYEHDPFEVKYRYIIGRLSLNQALQLTAGPDLLVLRVEDYTIKGILWEAIAEMRVLPPLICTHAYESMFDSGSQLANISSQLSNFIEATPPAAQRLIPLKLAALIAAIVWPNDLAQLAKATGTYPELLKLQAAFVKYDLLRQLDVSDKFRKNYEFRRQLKDEADTIYTKVARDSPPAWISPNLLWY